MSLDSFLRDLWLECCGHMSAFSIGQMRYSAQPMGHGNQRGMDVRLAAILTEEAEFSYEYDFGTLQSCACVLPSAPTITADVGW